MSAERTLRDTYYVFFGGTSAIGQAAAMEIARRQAHILVVGRDAAPALRR